jgi:hypothetical protein
MYLTASFLGDPKTWRRVQLSLWSVHGLWGGQVVVVAGAAQRWCG